MIHKPLASLLAQVAAAANRAMEMPLQEHALFGSPGRVQMAGTPSMQQLQAEQEEQMRFHQQQQYMYGQPQPLPASLAGSNPRYMSGGGAHQPAHLAGFQQPQYGGQPEFFEGSAASAQRPLQALQGLPPQLPGLEGPSGIHGIEYSGVHAPFESIAGRGPPLGHHFSHPGDPLSSGSSCGVDAGRSGSWGNTASPPRCARCRALPLIMRTNDTGVSSYCLYLASAFPCSLQQTIV